MWAPKNHEEYSYTILICHVGKPCFLEYIPHLGNTFWIQEIVQIPINGVCMCHNLSPGFEKLLWQLAKKMKKISTITFIKGALAEALNSCSSFRTHVVLSTNCIKRHPERIVERNTAAKMYRSHYNPQSVYFLPTLWRSKTFFLGFFRKFCLCVWLDSRVVCNQELVMMARMYNSLNELPCGPPMTDYPETSGNLQKLEIVSRDIQRE